MGLLDKIKSGLQSAFNEKSHAENAELAYQLFCYTYGGPGADKRYTRKVNQIRKDLNNERIPILIYAAELVGEPKTPKELYTVSHAYLWAGATVRDKAIIYMEKYINSGNYFDESVHIIDRSYGFDIDSKKVSVSGEYMSLGKLYESEYRFNEALRCYETAYNLTPFFATGIYGIANVKVKQENVDAGIAVLQNATKSKYYTWPNYTDFRDVIDRQLAELEKKKAKGYVYKPRKKNT